LEPPTSAVGRKVTFTGTDTLRIVDGKIAEYWANADTYPSSFHIKEWRM
jgi:predicted SnoaL-like aldol condensation-catalyzing enzyme